MDKNRGILPVVGACAIVAVVFLVLVLAVPLYHGDVYWTGVAFGWVAIAVALASNLFVVFSSRSTQSALYRTSVSTVSILYVVVACGISFVFMLMPTSPAWLLVVIQVILLALCLAGLIGGGGAASIIERGEEATRAQTAAIATLRMQADALKNFGLDSNTRKALDTLCDELRYADPVSTPATISCDQRLGSYMAQLGTALQNGDGALARELCSQMGVIIRERAALCRSTK